MYKVTIGPAVDEDGNRDENYRNTLVITDDAGTREHWDGGEPEDNSFRRDWSWVKTELEKAYEQGKQDAAKEHQ